MHRLKTIPEIGVTISVTEALPRWTFRIYRTARSLATPSIRRQNGKSKCSGKNQSWDNGKIKFTSGQYLFLALEIELKFSFLG
jgi:hypothetical protein